MTRSIPKGFRLAATGAAIKRGGRDDMALIYSELDSSVAAMFTTNKVKGAPVIVSKARLRPGKARALVVNSGNANAVTGEQGIRDAEDTCVLVAEALGIPERQVFVSSTGVIGVPMPMKKIGAGVGQLVAGLGEASLERVARAIMTTDTYPKFRSVPVKVGRREGTLSVVCKGSGMIAPNMATMLAFFMTDVAVERRALKAALNRAVEMSFNRVTIDGDRSTSDTALIMANGALGNEPLKDGAPGYIAFCAALTELAYDMSREIVKDGEGATRLVEIAVKGARTDEDARRGAMAVAESLLVKTAIFGGDPNWGRIAAALGYSGIAVDVERMSVSISGVRLLDKGSVTGRMPEAEKVMREKEILIECHLGLGKGEARVLTCDLSYDYVRINAEYTT